MQFSAEERHLKAALDDIARLIVDRCQQVAEWGEDRPYDTVMHAIHRRVLDLTRTDTGVTPGNA